MSNIVKALSLKYQSEIESARANIEVYMNNPAGIGEHPDIVSAVDSELVKLSTAEDKLKSLESNYPEYEVSDSEYLTEGNENYPSSHPMMDEYGAGQTQGHLFDKDDAIEGE